MPSPDELLLRRIRDALDADPAVDAFAVEVTVEGGVAHLHGVVGSYAEKLEAVALTRRFTPGADVVNELGVRPYGERWRIPDTEIADDVRRRLGLALVESGGVDFTVDHHVVALTGRVPTLRERALIRHVVETAPGVDFVDNEVEIGYR